jgi:glutaredoxin
VQTPILYIKKGCPWCEDALGFFRSRGIQLNVFDVTVNAAALRQLRHVSGQSKCPTFEFGDFVVADFSVKEFLDAVDRHPPMRSQLGLDNPA